MGGKGKGSTLPSLHPEGDRDGVRAVDSWINLRQCHVDIVWIEVVYGPSDEVHDHPEDALSDKDQAMTPDEFKTLSGKVRALQTFMEKSNLGGQE